MAYQALQHIKKNVCYYFSINTLNWRITNTSKTFMANQTYSNDVVDDYLPGVGVYTPDEVELKLTEGLSKEELNFIRSIALMEWNIMLISQKSIHKSRKKSVEKIKTTKKREKVEEEQYLAQIEAKYQQEFKSRFKDKKRGSK